MRGFRQHFCWQYIIIILITISTAEGTRRMFQTTNFSARHSWRNCESLFAYKMAIHCWLQPFFLISGSASLQCFHQDMLCYFCSVFWGMTLELYIMLTYWFCSSLYRIYSDLDNCAYKCHLSYCMFYHFRSMRLIGMGFRNTNSFLLLQYTYALNMVWVQFGSVIQKEIHAESDSQESNHSLLFSVAERLKSSQLVAIQEDASW